MLFIYGHRKQYPTKNHGFLDYKFLLRRIQFTCNTAKGEGSHSSRDLETFMDIRWERTPSLLSHYKASIFIYHASMRCFQDLLIDSLLYDVLQQYPQGISEYDLMQALQERGDIPLLENAFSNKLNMFRAHFILYHALYQLRDQLWNDQLAHLDINSIMVCLQEYRAASAGLMPQDPLREYYLNLDNLEMTSEEDVEALLDAFWIRFNSQTERESALKVLELNDTNDISLIKSQYKRLAMQHHPDRGGSKTMLQKINAAKSFLVAHHARETKKILE